jgi:hypothetical protein
MAQASPAARLHSSIRAPALSPCQLADAGRGCVGVAPFLARVLVSPTVGDWRDSGCPVGRRCRDRVRPASSSLAALPEPDARVHLRERGSVEGAVDVVEQFVLGAHKAGCSLARLHSTRLAMARLRHGVGGVAAEL